MKDPNSNIQERAKAIAAATANAPEFQRLDSWRRGTLTKSALDRAEMLLCAEIDIPHGWKKWLPFLKLGIFDRLFRKFTQAILRNHNEASKQLLIALRNLQAENDQHDSV